MSNNFNINNLVVDKIQTVYHGYVKCPICGETRGEISINAWRTGDRYDGYESRACVYIEYACGHDRRVLGSV